MSFLGNLFGGSGGQSQTSSTNSTTNVNYAPWYESYAQDLLSRGQALSKTPFQPYDIGQMYAPFQPAQQQAFNQVYQNQNAYQPYIGAGVGALNRVSGYDPYQSGMPFIQSAAMMPTGYQAGAPYMRGAAQTWNPYTQAQYTNPFLSGSVNYASDLARQNFLEKTLPGANAQFVKSGGGLGGRNYADYMARALRDFNTADIGQAQTAAANNYWQGANQFQNDMNRQLAVGQGLSTAATNAQGALGSLGQTASTITSGAVNTGTGLSNAYGNTANQLSNLNLANTNALLQAGNQQQQFAQNPLTAQYQQFQQGVQFPYTQLSWLGNLSSGLRIPSTQNTQGTTTQTQSASSSPSILGGILGAGSMIAGIPGVGSALGGMAGSLFGGWGGQGPGGGNISGFPGGMGPTGPSGGAMSSQGWLSGYASGGDVRPARDARGMRGYGGAPVAAPSTESFGMSRMPMGMLRGMSRYGGMSAVPGYRISAPMSYGALQAPMPSLYQYLAPFSGVQYAPGQMTGGTGALPTNTAPAPAAAPAAAPVAQTTPAAPTSSAAELWARSGMDANTTAGYRKGGAIRRYSQGGTIPVVKAVNAKSKPALAMAAQNAPPPVPMPRPPSGALARAAAPMTGGALSAVR